MRTFVVPLLFALSAACSPATTSTLSTAPSAPPAANRAAKHAPSGEPPLPNTRAARALADWLAAVNGESADALRAFYESRYAASMNPPGAIDDRVRIVRQSIEEEGPRRLRRVDHADDTDITAVLEAELTERWYLLHMRLGDDGRIVEATLNPADRPDDFGERGVLDDAAVASRLGAYVDTLASRGLFSGAAVVARGGKPIFTRAAGLANRAWKAPMAIDTKLNIASMGKMFTSVAIAQLVQAKKLAYSDTLAAALPDYPRLDIARRITIAQLLTHTSGLGDYFNDDYEKMSKGRLRAVKDYFPLFVDKPLQFEPGAGWSYSNAGFMVLGAIIEHASGEDYFAYVRRHVFAPAGMNDTDAYELDHDTPNLAFGYTRAPDAARDEWTNNLFQHVVKGGPAGGSFSTAPDLTRFATALLDGKLLDRALVARITSKSVDTPWGAYGYGFDVRPVRGHLSFGHNGGFPGIDGTLTVIADLGVSVAVLANLDPPAAERVSEKALDLLTQR